MVFRPHSKKKWPLHDSAFYFAFISRQEHISFETFLSFQFSFYCQITKKSGLGFSRLQERHVHWIDTKPCQYDSICGQKWSIAALMFWPRLARSEHLIKRVLTYRLHFYMRWCAKGLMSYKKGPFFPSLWGYFLMLICIQGVTAKSADLY